MNRTLAKALIEKGVIRAASEVDAKYQGLHLGGINTSELVGTFILKRAYESEKKGIYFDVASIIDGKPYRIMVEDIVKIDGMDMERVAAIYNLDIEGNPQRAAKRRGRRPKNWVPEDDFF